MYICTGRCSVVHMHVCHMSWLYMYNLTGAYTRLDTYTCISQIRIHIYAHVHAVWCRCRYATCLDCICIYIYLHTYVHTHTHTCTAMHPHVVAPTPNWLSVHVYVCIYITHKRHRRHPITHTRHRRHPTAPLIHTCMYVSTCMEYVYIFLYICI